MIHTDPILFSCNTEVLALMSQTRGQFIVHHGRRSSAGRHMHTWTVRDYRHLQIHHDKGSTRNRFARTRISKLLSRVSVRKFATNLTCPITTQTHPYRRYSSSLRDVYPLAPHTTIGPLWPSQSVHSLRKLWRVHTKLLSSPTPNRA
jgi:hypothetical protein